jgi:hypothetical protein
MSMMTGSLMSFKARFEFMLTPLWTPLPPDFVWERSGFTVI